MSCRPGRIVDEIPIEIGDRDDPLRRRQDGKVAGYMARLMDRLEIAQPGRTTARAATRMTPYAQRLIRRGTAASLVLFVVFLAAWEWGPGLARHPDVSSSRPLSAVYTEFIRMLSVNHLMFHTGVTAAEVIAGFILGSLLGAVFGYLLGMSPTAEFALSPYILALQIAPKVAFAPLFIMWMGFTVYPKILVAILIVFFPVMVNVLTAIRGIDPDLINLARSFKASRAQIFWKIEFPCLDAAAVRQPAHRLRRSRSSAWWSANSSAAISGLGYLLTFGEGQAQHADGFRLHPDADADRRHRLSGGHLARAARAALHAGTAARRTMTVSMASSARKLRRASGSTRRPAPRNHGLPR